MNAPNGFTKEQQAYLQGLMLGTDVLAKCTACPCSAVRRLGTRPLPVM